MLNPFVPMAAHRWRTRFVLIPSFAFLCLILAGCGLLFCKERETYLKFTIQLQDGRFGKKFHKKKFDIVSILMIRCDTSTASRIRSFPYDSTKGVNLGTLKLYLKGNLVYQQAIQHRNYAMNWPHFFGVANTGYDTLKVDSLEIVNASELLNGLEAELLHFNKCMC